MNIKELEKQIKSIYLPLLNKFDYIYSLCSPLFIDNNHNDIINDYLNKIENAISELKKIQKEIIKELEKMIENDNFDNYYKLMHIYNEIYVYIRNLEFFKYKIKN